MRSVISLKMDGAALSSFKSVNNEPVKKCCYSNNKKCGFINGKFRFQKSVKSKAGSVICYKQAFTKVFFLEYFGEKTNVAYKHNSSLCLLWYLRTHP